MKQLAVFVAALLFGAGSATAQVKCDANCTYDAAAAYQDCLRDAAQNNQQGPTDESCQSRYQTMRNYCDTCRN